MANQPLPIRGTQFVVVLPIFDNDGDLVTGAAGLDSKISKDNGTFADCTNEATEIATSSGMYYLTLTATEMTADIVTVIVKTSTTNAKTTPITLYPYGSVAGTEAGDGSGLANTLADIRWLLRAKLNDLNNSGAVGGNYSTKALDAFINLAYRETVVKTRSRKSSVTLTLVDGTSEYDCTTVFAPTEVVIGADVLERTDLKMAGVSLETWNTTPKDTPTKWMQSYGDYIRLYPTPDAGAASCISTVTQAPVAGGTGYVVGDELTLGTDVGAAGGKVVVTEVSSGVVTAVRLSAGGTGYTTGTKATTGGTGTLCTVSVATIGKATVNGFAYPTALTTDAHTPDSLPDGLGVQAILNRAECHARRARPTHANNAVIAAQLETAWAQDLVDIKNAISAEG